MVEFVCLFVRRHSKERYKDSSGEEGPVRRRFAGDSTATGITTVLVLVGVGVGQEGVVPQLQE